MSMIKTACVTALASFSLFFAIFQLATSSDVFISTSLKALGLGSIYALIALGYALIFKATQTINFAQGALASAGALFLTFLVADEHIPFTTINNPINLIGGPAWVGWALNLAVALIFAAALGLIVEVVAIRPMVGQPLFAVAVITLGLEIVLRVFNNDATETTFRSLETPWGANSFNVGETSVSWSSIAAIATAAIAFMSVYLFYRSQFGIAMRAVAFDQEAAMAQGVNVGQVFAVAWCIGSVLAAVGGIFATQPPVSRNFAVTADTANIAFRALPAVILGGLDSVTGALVGGIIVGVAEVFAGQYASQHNEWLGSGYQLIVPYVVMLIGLLVKPYGLFGTPEIRRV